MPLPEWARPASILAQGGGRGTEDAPAELWRRHQSLDGLYRFYFEKILGFHSLYLPFAGGVVAYVLTHPGRTTALGLLVPLFVSAVSAWIFAATAQEAKTLNAAVNGSAAALGLPATHARILVRVVQGFLALHVVLAGVLLAATALLLYQGALPG
jgi:hypothetical protein